MMRVKENREVQDILTAMAVLLWKLKRYFSSQNGTEEEGEMRILTTRCFTLGLHILPRVHF